MKFILIFFFTFLLQNCSFDNKSGIWENERTSTKKNSVFKDFKPINISNKSFQKIIPIKKDFKFTEINTIDNYNWKDIYSQPTLIEDDERMDIIGQNGNDGLYYDEEPNEPLEENNPNPQPTAKGGIRTK